MSFPNSQRVIFGRNPLAEVVCQLRFPPVLRIDTETPSAFQDSIRDVFPFYQRISQTLPINMGLPPDIMQALAMGGSGVHEFASSEQAWKLSLSKDFIALTTDQYTNWSDFKTRLQDAVSALNTVYKPAFFTRSGLRYRNVIRRSAFGLQDAPWAELIRPGALGELADENLGPRVEHILRELVVSNEDKSRRARVVHGLQSVDNEVVYLIDSDLFTENRTETTVVSDVLDELNRQAGDLFRWYIAPRLHERLDPSSTGE